MFSLLSKGEAKKKVKVAAFIGIGKLLNSNDRWKAKCSQCQEYIIYLGIFILFIKVMKGLKVITSTARCRFKTSRPLNIIYLRTNSTRKKAFIPRNYAVRCFRICFKKIVEFWFHEKRTPLTLSAVWFFTLIMVDLEGAGTKRPSPHYSFGCI